MRGCVWVHYEAEDGFSSQKKETVNCIQVLLSISNCGPMWWTRSARW